MGIDCVGTNAIEFLDKVKFNKLFIVILVYAFFSKRWVCVERWVFYD